MEITAIRRQKGKRDRVNVYLSDGRRVTLSAEQVYRAGLRREISIAEDHLARLVEEDCEIRAKDAALRLLGYRPRTLAELRGRLAGKGFGTTAVEACLDQLATAGLIDDAEFAGAFVRDRIRGRPRGIGGLKADLQARGIDAETASNVIRRELAASQVGELDLAWMAARKFRPRKGEEPRATLRRLHGYLGRRGFSAESIAGVVSEWRSKSLTRSTLDSDRSPTEGVL